MYGISNYLGILNKSQHHTNITERNKITIIQCIASLSIAHIHCQYTAYLEQISVAVCKLNLQYVSALIMRKVHIRLSHILLYVLYKLVEFITSSLSV